MKTFNEALPIEGQKISCRANFWRFGELHHTEAIKAKYMGWNGIIGKAIIEIDTADESYVEPIEWEAIRAGGIILTGDCLKILPNLPVDFIQCVITSPPYWGLRDYGCNGQIGLEKYLEAYIEKLVAVFREVRRILKPDGCVFLNLGDEYARNPGKGEKFRGKSKGYLSHNHDRLTGPEIPVGLKPKDLIGIPWRVAFALQADGWFLRSEIIWHKPNPMPESVTDRPTRNHEQIFLLTKSERYFYNSAAIKETPTRNRRSVWTITTKPFKEAHFATFPPEIPMLCILAGSRVGDIVLDPFAGAGTTGVEAEKSGREFIGIELNPAYTEMGEKRIEAARLPLLEVM